MEKMKIKLLAALLSLLLVPFYNGCKPDDEEDKDKPVLNKDFKYEVDANGYKVTFTSMYPSGTTVSWTNVESNTTSTEPVWVVEFTKKGDHKMVFAVMIEGTFVPSDTFIVTTTKDNLAFLETKLWKALTGGIGKTKTWRMDINADGKCVEFAGPLFYSGYADGDNRKTEWSYWAWDLTPAQVANIATNPIKVNNVEQKSIFNWSPDYASNTWLMAAKDYGTITFDGEKGTVKTVIFGETKEGTFTFDTATMKLTLTNVTIPIDTGRINEGQFKPNDLLNLRIFYLKDSALQIGVKRSYEGKNPDGSQKVSEWVHVYNFVCADYTYAPETYTFQESVKTSFTKADLVGTWKYDQVAQGWIAWTKVGSKGTYEAAHRFETWATRSDMVTTLVSWGASKADSIFTANDAKRFTFNNDGTCTLAGKANTYSVANGVITFGNDLTDEWSLVWITLTGKELKVIDVTKQGDMSDYTYNGIWIGQKNGTKNEYQAVHLIKE